MKRNAISWLVLLLTLLSISAPALAAVEGTWGVGGNASIFVKIQGSPAQKGRQYVNDIFTFGAGGAFTMVDASGTWTQTGSNFRVTLNASEIVAMFEQQFASQGYTVDVTVTSLVLKGKETAGGERLHGRLTMLLHLYIHNFARNGKVKSTFPFNGTRLGGVPGLAADALPPALALREVVAKSVADVISQLDAQR